MHVEKCSILSFFFFHWYYYFKASANGVCWGVVIKVMKQNKPRFRIITQQGRGKTYSYNSLSRCDLG